MLQSSKVLYTVVLYASCSLVVRGCVRIDDLQDSQHCLPAVEGVESLPQLGVMPDCACPALGRAQHICIAEASNKDQACNLAQVSCLA